MAELKRRRRAQVCRGGRGFSNMVYEQADSLQPAADKFKLTIQKTDFFDQAESLPQPARWRQREAVRRPVLGRRPEEQAQYGCRRGCAEHAGRGARGRGSAGACAPFEIGQGRDREAVEAPRRRPAWPEGGRSEAGPAEARRDGCAYLEPEADRRAPADARLPRSAARHLQGASRQAAGLCRPALAERSIAIYRIIAGAPARPRARRSAAQGQRAQLAHSAAQRTSSYWRPEHDTA
jgi:peptidyl-prolyl cis-trans isomerase D